MQDKSGLCRKCCVNEMSQMERRIYSSIAQFSQWFLSCDSAAITYHAVETVGQVQSASYLLWKPRKRIQNCRSRSYISVLSLGSPQHNLKTWYVGVVFQMGIQSECGVWSQERRRVGKKLNRRREASVRNRNLKMTVFAIAMLTQVYWSVKTA